MTNQRVMGTPGSRRVVARVAGWMLVLAGVALVVVGFAFASLARGLCENDCGPQGGAGWFLALLYLSVIAVPGLVVVGGGYLLLRWSGMARPAAPAVITVGAVGLVAWLGTAFAMSDPFPPARTSPPVVVRTPQQQAADQAAFAARNAEDARRHPIPQAVLRAQERKLAAQLRKAGVVSAPITVHCRRSWEWTVSCQFSPTLPDGRFIVDAQYLPQSRMLLLDEPLPASAPTTGG